MSVDQMTNDEIMEILEHADINRRGEQTPIHEQLFAANLFYEPSTRTKMSFIVAQRKLGIEVLDLDAEGSSVQKGESLYDTVKTFEAIGANIAVIRHPDDQWDQQLKGNINIPIINAGAGKKEHPTQCLLDLLTLYQEFHSFHNLNIVIAGDIKHSRVARSNAYALKRLGANVYLSAAPQYKDPTLEFEYLTMDEAVEMCDAMMLLRIQHERHDQFNSNAHYLDAYGLTKEREQKMQDHSIILHPAPINRGVEIDTDLVECDRSRIFKQMNNGVFIRMAIMTQLLEKRGIIHGNPIKKRKVFHIGQASY